MLAVLIADYVYGGTSGDEKRVFKRPIISVVATPGGDKKSL